MTKVSLPNASLAVRLVAMLLFGAPWLTGCGGSTTTAHDAVQPDLVKVTFKALASSSEVAGGVLVLRKYNSSTDNAIIKEPPIDLLKLTIGELDIAGIPWVMGECGFWTRGLQPSQEFSGGFGDWGPIGMTFRVRSQDLEMVTALGFEIVDPANLDNIVNQGACRTSLAANVPSRIFQFAKLKYPQYFSEPASPGDYEGYSYTYFYEAGLFLAVKEGRVFLHNGKDLVLQDVGAVGDFIPGLRCAGLSCN